MKINKLCIVFLLINMFSSHINYALSASDQLLVGHNFIDASPVIRLQEKLRSYAENDDHIKDLLTTLNVQAQQIDSYNAMLGSFSELAPEQQNSLLSKAFQDAISFSHLDFKSLEKISNAVIVSKQIDLSWQIKQYGFFHGTLSFAKNLFLPQSYRNYFCAGAGALTGCLALRSLPKISTTINITLPADSKSIIINENQQKVMTTVAACVLGAGGAVAAMQFYTSWMHEQNSRDLLVDKIQAMKIKNALIDQKFDSLSIKKQLSRSERKIDNLTGISIRTNQSLAIANDKLDHLELVTKNTQQDVQAVKQLSEHMRAQLHKIAEQFGCSQEQVTARFIQLESNMQQGIKQLQNDFGRIEGMMIAQAMLQMTIHQENKESFQAMHNNMEALQKQQQIKPFTFNNKSSSDIYQASFLIAQAQRKLNLGKDINIIQEDAQSKNNSALEEVD